MLGFFKQTYYKYTIDVHAKDEAGNTPLHNAVLERNLNMIEALKGSGIDFEAKNNEGKTALAIAIERDDWVSIKSLVLAGADY